MEGERITMITIRLKPMGTKNCKKWRVVVTDSRVSRSGRLIEEIGVYDPSVDPPKIQIKKERYEEWIRKGAQPSQTLKSLVKNEKKSASAH